MDETVEIINGTAEGVVDGLDGFVGGLVDGTTGRFIAGVVDLG